MLNAYLKQLLSEEQLTVFSLGFKTPGTDRILQEIKNSLLNDLSQLNIEKPAEEFRLEYIRIRLHLVLIEDLLMLAQNPSTLET